MKLNDADRCVKSYPYFNKKSLPVIICYRYRFLFNKYPVAFGTIRLNINDIFRTMINHSQTIAINQVSAFSTRQTDTRRVGLSFSYRFGKAANARKRNNNGSAEDEKGRTN